MVFYDNRKRGTRNKERCRKKNSCKQLGDEKKFVHRKIAQPPPPLKYLMVRPLHKKLYSHEHVRRALSAECAFCFLIKLKNSRYFYIKGDLQSVCKQSLCLHFCVQNIELYSTTIYIFKLLEYNK